MPSSWPQATKTVLSGLTSSVWQLNTTWRICLRFCADGLPLDAHRRSTSFMTPPMASGEEDRRKKRYEDRTSEVVTRRCPVARRLGKRLAAEDRRMARPPGDNRDFQKPRRGPYPNPENGSRRGPPSGPVRPRRPLKGRLRVPERTLSLLAARARPVGPPVGIIRRESHDGRPRGADPPHRRPSARWIGPA